MDKFVKNLQYNPPKTAPRLTLDKVVKNQAVKNALKTIACKPLHVLRVLKQAIASPAFGCGHLCPHEACLACIHCSKNRGSAIWKFP